MVTLERHQCSGGKIGTRISVPHSAGFSQGTLKRDSKKRSSLGHSQQIFLSEWAANLFYKAVHPAGKKTLSLSTFAK